jgi:hypothetical protein
MDLFNQDITKIHSIRSTGRRRADGSLKNNSKRKKTPNLIPPPPKEKHDLFEPTVSINPSYIAVYDKYYGRKKTKGSDLPPDYDYQDGIRVNCDRCHKPLSIVEIDSDSPTCTSCLNLKNNHHGLDLSKTAKKKFLNAIDWLFILAKVKMAYNEYLSSWFPFKVALLTLSLPCQQLHDDLFFKKHLLNDFFNVLRRKYSLQNYAWRAEKKKNGTIHIHILLDIYVDCHEYNRIWNHILDKYGYIAQYRKNQQEWHKNGFRYRPDLALPFNKITGEPQKIWNYYSQLKAYKKGIAENWTQPVGSSDVHSIRGVKDTRLYMGKYVTKKVELAKQSDSYNKAVMAGAADQLTFFVTETVDEEKAKKIFMVDGSIWYISKSLSQLKPAVTKITKEVKAEISGLKITGKFKIVEHDRCLVIFLTIFDLILYDCTNLIKCIRSHIEDARARFYDSKSGIYSNIGYALNLFEIQT